MPKPRKRRERVRETFTTRIEDSGWQDEKTGRTIYRFEDGELKVGTKFRKGNLVRVTVESIRGGKR